VKKFEECTLREFRNEWKKQYLFSMGDGGKPICLVCGTCVAVVKKYNLSRHYNTNHSSLDVTHPVGSDLRHEYIARKDSERHGTVNSLCL